jgi:hypothetical protein
MVDFGMQVLTERRRVRSGSRLIAADLRKADKCLKEMEEDKKWSQSSAFPTSSWAEYRSVLIGKLTREEFDDVAYAMVALDRMAEIREESQVEFGHEVELTDDEVINNIADLRASLAVTYNAVARLGDLKPVGSRIRERR